MTSIFPIEPIADFCPILGYWSNYIPLERQSYADQYLQYWPSESGSRDHDVKDEFVSVAKSMAFGAAGR